MHNVLITGANRGLGFAFTQYYLNQGHQVYACYRQDEGQLPTLDHSNLTLFKWDVSKDIPVDLLDKLPSTIDLLINNAGIYGPTKSNGQSLDGIQPKDMLTVFEVNCVGPLRVVKSVKDRLIKSQGIIANISSRMGSTADNSSGGCYAYRASKAALVIVSKSMAVDLEPHGVRVITLHPGWVKTDMTDHTGEIDAQESVNGMAAIIENIDHYEGGAFVAWDGEILPY